MDERDLDIRPIENGRFCSAALERFPWLSHDLTNVDRDAWLRDPDGSIGGSPTGRFICASQTHGDAIATLDARHPMLGGSKRVIRLPQTDGLIVAVPDVSVAVATADCAPVVVVDVERKIAAVVHSGWRGTMVRIVAKAIRRMMVLGSDASDLFVWIGPSVSGANYEVSEELAARFGQEFPDEPGVVDGRQLDLARCLLVTALSVGVENDRVFNCGVCTVTDDRFPSYRRDGDGAGRMVTRISIAG